jgi:hypothetical protein
MLQGTDNGKHKAHDTISVALCDKVFIARSVLAVAPLLGRCL